MKLSTKLVTVAVAGITSVAVVAGTASAATVAPLAQSNSISGSSSTSWYTSTSLRHVTTANDTIKVGLHSFPAALQWELVNANNNSVFAGPTAINSTDWVVVATQVLNGTQFYNRYKSGTAGNFNGNEYY